MILEDFQVWSTIFFWKEKVLSRQSMIVANIRSCQYLPGNWHSWDLSKDPEKVFTSGTYMRSSGYLPGTNEKNNDLSIKWYFGNNGLSIKYLFLLFSEGANIFKSLMGTSPGGLRDPVGRRAPDKIMKYSTLCQYL